ncbi:hypothetical protein Tco_0691597 [Tanacetum coccineum]
MESSSSNSEERELQQMQMEERELHQNCLAWFTKLKTHLEFLHNINSHSVGRNRPHEIAFRIFFHEEHETFRIKIDVSSCVEQESLVSEGTTLEYCLVTNDAELEACLVTGGIELDDSLVAKKSTDDSVTSSEQLNESNSSHNESNNSRNEIRSYDNEISSLDGNDVDADTGHSYDSNTVTDVPYSNNDTFENVFAHGIQNHEQPESFPDTYVVNENNSNIISNIPNMDKDRVKEEHDCVAYEQ